MISETLTYAAGVLVLVGGFALSGYAINMTKPVSVMAPTNDPYIELLREHAPRLCPTFDKYPELRQMQMCERFGY